MKTEQRPVPDPEDMAAVVKPWAALAALAPQAVRLVPVEGGQGIEVMVNGSPVRVGWMDRLGGVSRQPVPGRGHGTRLAPGGRDAGVGLQPVACGGRV